ncbi:hypothetical protein [Pedobacter sp. BMA]|uniref:hypothetical protein n=1 Tax=Pedobacter sp. BMA TaxID=1663685 RepID=UPI0012E04844|nr:hypothetical protein [Pedobacter sp. BMA]
MLKAVDVMLTAFFASIQYTAICPGTTHFFQTIETEYKAPVNRQCTSTGWHRTAMKAKILNLV